MKKHNLLGVVGLLLTVLPLSARLQYAPKGQVVKESNRSQKQKVSTSIDTERKYLSGHGCDDMVDWDFYCTGGRNSGHWTKIGVPSCWELQGFGTYQYGMRFYGIANPPGIADEKGKYKYEFTLPEQWRDRQIELVFEAVMTDARVTINGRKAGSGKHQGGFYRFSFDVSDRIYFGNHKNVLEVEVSKESANSQVNMAERRADYWNFGGIIRPVFIVSKPALNINRVAINAGMDGRFQADCFLNRAINGAKVRTTIYDNGGKAVGESTTDCRNSDEAHVDLTVKSPKLWTAETPNRYEAVFELLAADGKVLHRERQKFGFRTIEYRKSDGIYINGTKVILKGVNRHSFRPESGRTLSPAKCIEDVELIKSMNMNAVRLSHYPADPEFLDACDSLGLYVDCELSGWHWAHETVVGQQLVMEMVTRDVNHPSIIFWTNGNEGGFNYELEPWFHKYDPQNRVVLYPWSNRNGFETKHYRSYGETEEYMRQPEIFMPTEFLHGLYDGGHGAGLADYWKMMMANPRCAGGFLWDLADEGVVRTDKDNIVDCMGNFGADGIVGPHFEKEGSYYTIKEVWCPVQLERSDNGNSEKQGKLTLNVRNTYNFTNLNKCSFSYRFLKLPQPSGSKAEVLKQGKLRTLDIKPGSEGSLTIEGIPADANGVEVSCTDASGKEIMTWTYPVNASPTVQANNDGIVNYAETADGLTATIGNKEYTFSKTTGMLSSVRIGAKAMSFGNGPRFIAARRSDRSFDQFYNHDDKDAEKKKTQYTLYKDYGSFAGFSESTNTLTTKYDNGTIDSVVWKFGNDGTVNVAVSYHFGGVVDLMGISFDYPESKVQSKSWVGKGPYRVWQNRTQGPQYGYWENEYNDPIPGESWDYPEFKGYFDEVAWMQLRTTEGRITLSSPNAGDKAYIGVYQPRDGRDHILYELPETGISVLKVIPAVRNKVNTTDLNGPSAQPKWENGSNIISVVLKFDI